MALVRKILEATIPSGGSSATFTDNDIPNSLIRVYSTNSNIYPQNISLTGNTLTVTYEVVSSALGVAVELVKQGLEIDDNLTSDNTDHALSAKQGKVLKGLIDNIPDDLSELSDVDITDIEDGQVLAWDETAEKFVNVDQSGGSSHTYSTTEQVIGTWVDGKPLYETTFLNVSISTSPTVLVTNIDIFVNAPIINRKYSSGSIYTVTHCGVNTNNDIVFTTSSNTLSIAAESSSYNGGTVTCTVQYTKSTD